MTNIAAGFWRAFVVSRASSCSIASFIAIIAACTKKKKNRNKNLIKNIVNGWQWGVFLNCLKWGVKNIAIFAYSNFQNK